MRNTIDYPHLRKSLLCPLCKSAKPQNLVVCWPCWRGSHELEDPTALATIDHWEESLAEAYSPEALKVEQRLTDKERAGL